MKYSKEEIINIAKNHTEFTSEEVESAINQGVLIPELKRIVNIDFLINYPGIDHCIYEFSNFSEEELINAIENYNVDPKKLNIYSFVNKTEEFVLNYLKLIDERFDDIILYLTADYNISSLLFTKIKREILVRIKKGEHNKSNLTNLLIPYLSDYFEEQIPDFVDYLKKNPSYITYIKDEHYWTYLHDNLFDESVNNYYLKIKEDSEEDSDRNDKIRLDQSIYAGYCYLYSNISKTDSKIQEMLKSKEAEIVEHIKDNPNQYVRNFEILYRTYKIKEFLK